MVRKDNTPCEGAGPSAELREKAETILRLRSRLPSMEGIYFSPSTGEFFRSAVKYSTLTRYDVSEDELPADEIAAKRAAALLCSFAERDAELRRQFERAQDALLKAYGAREQLTRDFEAARGVVERFELPE